MNSNLTLNPGDLCIITANSAQRYVRSADGHRVPGDEMFHIPRNTIIEVIRCLPDLADGLVFIWVPSANKYANVECDYIEKISKLLTPGAILRTNGTVSVVKRDKNFVALSNFNEMMWSYLDEGTIVEFLGMDNNNRDCRCWLPIQQHYAFIPIAWIS